MTSQDVTDATDGAGEGVGESFKWTRARQPCQEH